MIGSQAWEGRSVNHSQSTGSVCRCRGERIAQRGKRRVKVKSLGLWPLSQGTRDPLISADLVFLWPPKHQSHKGSGAGRSERERARDWTQGDMRPLSITRQPGPAHCNLPLSVAGRRPKQASQEKRPCRGLHLLRTKRLSLSNQGASARGSPLKSDFTIPARIHKISASMPCPIYPCPSCTPPRGQSSIQSRPQPSHLVNCFVSTRVPESGDCRSQLRPLTYQS